MFYVKLSFKNDAIDFTDLEGEKEVLEFIANYLNIDVNDMFFESRTGMANSKEATDFIYCFRSKKEMGEWSGDPDYCPYYWHERSK